jgi:RuvB-like protein 2
VVLFSGGVLFVFWVCGCACTYFDSSTYYQNPTLHFQPQDPDLISNPIVIITAPAGTNYRSPHGIPIDLLDRLLIINTQPYSEAELKKILEIRFDEEDVTVAPDASDLLTKIAVETSLRYAIHLVSAAALAAQRRKATAVDVEDVSKAYTLFLDVKRSVQYLQEYEEEYLFNEAVGDGPGAEGNDGMEADAQ